MPRVEISDSENGFLAFDLKEVLDTLPEQVRNYRWYMLAVEAVGKGLHGKSMLSTEQIVNSNPNGLQLTFEELQEFARGLEQTLNTIVFAGDERCPPPSLPLTLPALGNYVLIEAIDTSLWAVSSNDQRVTDCMLKRFRSSKVTA
jgi:hypothetical protein